MSIPIDKLADIDARLDSGRGKGSSLTRRHKHMFVASSIGFEDAVRITRPGELFDAVRMHKIAHWAKGYSDHPDDIRRYVGQIHVWERW